MIGLAALLGAWVGLVLLILAFFHASTRREPEDWDR